MRQTGIEAHVIVMPANFDFFMDLVAHDPEQLTLTGTTGGTWTQTVRQ